ncbi:sensor histidine kinase [Lichenifustis flavocetrariae]|uniref:histidine kinase n=1 Tax=Lichenifustis flavocetrariae TaxID=2949735 RepID=A0AA41YZB2_9HYPH|nr:PAS domain-containing protein [Lichenifustis flavocetrariae]MCW6510061.1 PAS domain-containing protein [Lichenifustis flavocetrariae]
MIEGTPDPIFVKDRDGRFVRVNSVLARIFGVAPEVVRGKRDRDFMPETSAKPIEDADRKVIETGMPLVIEELVEVKGRGRRYFLSTKAPWYNRRGEITGLIGISQDIHERKQAELEVRSANAQKEILLHDINHRVKNHLQSVMSLLAMSERRLVDPVAKTEIANAVSRLSVLARVYDRLRVKEDAGTATVSIRDYLQGLCDEVAPTLTGLRPIVVRTRLDDADLDAGQAVSLGLAVNELLQNSVKHAFPEDRAGVITIFFGLRDPDSFCVEVSDDGIGMRPGSASTHTGTRLVRALAHQLGGTVNWEGPPGTRVQLIWPRRGTA